MWPVHCMASPCRGRNWIAARRDGVIKDSVRVQILVCSSILVQWEPCPVTSAAGPTASGWRAEERRRKKKKSVVQFRHARHLYRFDHPLLFGVTWCGYFTTARHGTSAWESVAYGGKLRCASGGPRSRRMSRRLSRASSRFSGASACATSLAWFQAQSVAIISLLLSDRENASCMV